ncbi:MAG TPA: PIN domain-containing protein [Candidatus Paceibacterota bacterium]
MILDSNILIGYLNGDQDIISRVQSWRDTGVVLFISPVSAIEALSLASLTEATVVATENFLNDFIIVPVDARIIRTGSALRRAYRLSVPDAAIVATAIENKLPLATRDKKMRSVPGIVLVDI